VFIKYSIPPETIRGTEDIVKVILSINVVDTDTTYSSIVCLSKSTKPEELASIVIFPPEINLNLGEQHLFTATALTIDEDTLHYFKPAWHVTGGMIDLNGLYHATETGDFFVICSDTASSIKDSAIVHIHSTGVESEKESVQKKFVLQQNYPNPFNATTIVEFSIPSDNNVEIKVFDFLGREITTILNEFKKEGNHKIRFNEGNLTSGVYFYTIKSGMYSEMKKMILVK